MQEIFQMAERLGQSLARTDEYQSLKRAIDASGDDRELAEGISKVMLDADPAIFGEKSEDKVSGLTY